MTQEQFAKACLSFEAKLQRLAIGESLPVVACVLSSYLADAAVAMGMAISVLVEDLTKEYNHAKEQGSNIIALNLTPTNTNTNTDTTTTATHEPGKSRHKHKGVR